ncbi:MAG TPA: PAS domain-containing sensor histidine kinase, partial [Ideonella sp.]|nr:PAS domain-containing sensor histidine kinase [Ideonella sp.]
MSTPSATPSDHAPHARTSSRRTSRLLDTWWRRQSPTRQDRFATIGPLISVLLFLAAIIAAFWYLRNEEFEREQESVKRDTEVAQQQIRLRLIENQEQLTRIAREISTRSLDPDDFLEQAAAFTRERPEVTHLSWINAQRHQRASFATFRFVPSYRTPNSGPDPSMPAEESKNEPEQTFNAARDMRQAVYSRPFTDLGER